MGVINGQSAPNHHAATPSGMTGSQANAQSNGVPATASVSGGNPNTYKPDRESNKRFRSFAERFVVERIRNLPGDVDDHALHRLTLQARTAYKMIKEAGYTLEPND